MVSASVERVLSGFAAYDQKELNNLRDRIGKVTKQEYEISLEKQTLDFALLAFVLHEVPDRVRFLKKVAIYLKPDGGLIPLEWKKKKDIEGPPFKDRISFSVIDTSRDA